MSLRWADRDPEIEILPVVPVRVTAKAADTDLRRAERWAWGIVVFAWVYLIAQVLRALLRGRVF